MKRTLNLAADYCAALSKDVMGLIAPVACVGCGALDESLCPRCQCRIRMLSTAPFQAQEYAGAIPFLRGSGLRELLPVFAAGAYQGLLAQVLLSYKKLGDKPSQRALALALSRTLSAASKHCAAVEPLAVALAPASLSSRLTRGFVPISELAEHASWAFASREKVPLVITGGAQLRTLLSVQARSQKARGAHQRAKRTFGTMKARSQAPQPGQAVLIVDDVLTTGATIAEMYRALENAGYHVLAACVIAASVSTGAENFAPEQLKRF